MTDGQINGPDAYEPSRPRTVASASTRRLLAVLFISAAIFVVELAGGIASNSLALIADAGHVLADVAGVALALGAIWIARRPPTDDRTYGFYRAEILGALINAVVLLGLAAFIVYEAWQRLLEPPAVASLTMIAVAVAGGVANIASLLLLRRDRHASLTVRGAYLEVFGDLLGSIAVIVTAVVIAFTGIAAADSVASVVIALLILPRALGLLRDTIDVLLEAVPKGMRLSEVRDHLMRAAGVADVHDLHIWTITSGMRVASAHVVLTDGADAGAVLSELNECLATDFDVEHSTIQLETVDRRRFEGVRHQ